MNEFLLVLISPVGVVSIVVAVSVLIFEPVIIRMRKFFLVIIMQSPMFIRGLARSIRLKNMKKLKKIRQNGDEVTYQSIRANAYFILFLGTIAFYVAMIVLGPLKGINEFSTVEQLLLTIPIYIFEIIWIYQHADARQLIELRGKLRITSARRK